MAVAKTYAIPRSLARQRISPRALVGIAVAALGIAVLTVLYRAEQPRQMQVLRLTRDLPAGAVLSARDLQPVAEAVPEDMAATLVPAGEQAQLVGRRVGAPLSGGEYLTRGQLGHSNRGISPDQRLVVIPVDADTVAGLNLSRGDKVELTSTNKQQAGGAHTDIVVPAATVYEVSAGRRRRRPRGSAASSRNLAAARPGCRCWLTRARYRAINQARSTGDLLLALVPEDGQPR